MGGSHGPNNQIVYPGESVAKPDKRPAAVSFHGFLRPGLLDVKALSLRDERLQMNRIFLCDTYVFV